jgi:hypothetical protein
MKKINKLRTKMPKSKPGPKMCAPKSRNSGLEQAITEAGSIDALARRVGLFPGAIRSAREHGMTPRIALLLWEICKIKISTLRARTIKCPRCNEEL